jgi:hypothetical protein
LIIYKDKGVGVKGGIKSNWSQTVSLPNTNTKSRKFDHYKILKEGQEINISIE